MKKARKKQKERIDHFAFFKQATAETFKFLTTDSGFECVSTVQRMPDCMIQYQNATTGIRVYYELNSQLSVDIAKLRHTATEVIEDKSYDLLLLMKIRHPEIDVHKFYGGDKEWTNNYIERLLREYASFLRQEARDVLTGDFKIFPALKELAAQYRRQSTKELFGTYTGESPRFSKRPTLEDIFADAREQNKTLRIYEAHWDHQYSTKEIAAFLNVTDEVVKQALADFDDKY